MNEREIIEKVRMAREEEVRFFSNAAKPERERWVVREFLENLSVTFELGEIRSASESDNVDVLFREANFQVKELTEENCQRSTEVKEAVSRAEGAGDVMDLYEPLVAEDFEWVDAYPLITRFASNKRYPRAARGSLDLLIYVTRCHATLDRTKQPEDLALLGWRSISCLYGTRSFVLVAAKNAPPFLRDQLRRS